MVVCGRREIVCDVRRSLTVLHCPKSCPPGQRFHVESLQQSSRADHGHVVHHSGALYLYCFRGVFKGLHDWILHTAGALFLGPAWSVTCSAQLTGLGRDGAPNKVKREDWPVEDRNEVLIPPQLFLQLHIKVFAGLIFGYGFSIQCIVCWEWLCRLPAEDDVLTQMDEQFLFGLPCLLVS